MSETAQPVINVEDLFSENFSLDQLEQNIIRSAMDKSQQNVSEAARMLGISRATLDYRLKKITLG